MQGETKEGKMEGGGKQCAASAALVDLPPERKVTGWLACNVCVWWCLQTSLLFYWQPFSIYLFFSCSWSFPSQSCKFCSPPLPFCFSFFVLFCLFCPTSLPHATVYTHILLDNLERCSFECSTHVFLESQHQPWPGGPQSSGHSHHPYWPLSNLNFTSNPIGFADIRWANYSL